MYPQRTDSHNKHDKNWFGDSILLIQTRQEMLITPTLFNLLPMVKEPSKWIETGYSTLNSLFVEPIGSIVYCLPNLWLCLLKFEIEKGTQTLQHPICLANWCLNKVAMACMHLRERTRCMDGFQCAPAKAACALPTQAH